MKKLLDSLILCISLSCSSQAFAQTQYDQEYSDIVAADAAIQNKDYKKGIALYQQYLQKNPNDKAVVITLFRLQLTQGNYTEAKKLLKSYETKFGKDNTYLSETARYYVLVNKSDEASKTLTDYKTLKLNSIIQAANKAIKEKNYQQAITLYQEYSYLKPNDKKVDLAIIRLQLLQGNIDAVEQSFIEYEKKYSKNDFNYLVEKARYYALVKQPEAALKILNPLLAKNPNDAMLLQIKNYALNQQARQSQATEDLMLIAAKEAVNNNDVERGVKFYNRYLKKNPNDEAATLALIQLYLIYGNPEAAKKLLTSYVSKFPINDAYLLEKARYFVVTKDPEAALEILEPLLKKDPSNKVLFYLKQYALDEQVQQNRNQQLKLAEASLAIENKDYRKSIEIYTQYLQKNPQDKTITLTIIQLELMQSNVKNAEQWLNEYVKKFGEDNGYLTHKARYYVLIHQPDVALNIIEPMLKKDPANKLLLESKQYALSQKAYQNLVAMDLLLATAKQAAQNKDYPKSISLYQQYLKQNPNNKMAMIALIQLQILKENKPAADKLLGVYLSRFGKDDNYLIEKARFFILNNKSDEAISIINVLLKQQPSNPSLLELKEYALHYKERHGRILQNLMLTAATQAMRNKEYQKSISIYQQYLSQNPNDKNIALTLIQLQMMLANSTQVAQLLNEYATKFGEDEAYLTQKARYAILNNQPDEALAILQPLLTKNPTDKLLLDTKKYALNLKGRQYKASLEAILASAEAALSQKDIKKAIKYYEEYLNKNPVNKNVLKVLIGLQFKQGNYQEANKLLEIYAGRFNQDNFYNTERVRYFVLIDQPDQALNLVTVMLNQDPNNQSLLNVQKYIVAFKEQQIQTVLNTMLANADQAVQNNNLEKGINLYQHYLSQRPNDKTVTIKLIDLQLRQANYAYAEEMLSNYATRFGNDNNSLAQKVRLFIYTKKFDEALALLNKLLNNDPKNTQFSELRQYALQGKDNQYQHEQKPLLIAAQSAMNNKDINKAIFLYHQYLNDNPSDKAVLITLIRLELVNQNLSEAQKLLSAYAQKFGEDDPYFAEKAHFYVSSLKSATSQGKIFIESSDYKNDSNITVMHATHYEKNSYQPAQIVSSSPQEEKIIESRQIEPVVAIDEQDPNAKIEDTTNELPLPVISHNDLIKPSEKLDESHQNTTEDMPDIEDSKTPQIAVNNTTNPSNAVNTNDKTIVQTGNTTNIKQNELQIEIPPPSIQNGITTQNTSTESAVASITVATKEQKSETPVQESTITKSSAAPVSVITKEQNGVTTQNTSTESAVAPITVATKEKKSETPVEENTITKSAAAPVGVATKEQNEVKTHNTSTESAVASITVATKEKKSETPVEENTITKSAAAPVGVTTKEQNEVKTHNTSTKSAVAPVTVATKEKKSDIPAEENANTKSAAAPVSVTTKEQNGVKTHNTTTKPAVESITVATKEQKSDIPSEENTKIKSSAAPVRATTKENNGGKVKTTSTKSAVALITIATKEKKIKENANTKSYVESIDVSAKEPKNIKSIDEIKSNKKANKIEIENSQIESHKTTKVIPDVALSSTINTKPTENSNINRTRKSNIKQNDTETASYAKRVKPIVSTKEKEKISDRENNDVQIHENIQQVAIHTQKEVHHSHSNQIKSFDNSSKNLETNRSSIVHQQYRNDEPTPILKRKPFNNEPTNQKNFIKPIKPMYQEYYQPINESPSNSAAGIYFEFAPFYVYLNDDSFNHLPLAHAIENTNSLLNIDNQGKDWAYRLAIGYTYHSCCQHYGWSLELTHFNTNQDRQYDLSNQSFVFISPLNQAIFEPLDNITSNIKTNYSTVDLLGHWLIKQSAKLYANVFLGIRFLSLDQQLRASYNASLNNMGATLDRKIDLDYQGIGLRAGAKGDYFFNRYFGVTGEIAGNLLLGTRDYSEKIQIDNLLVASLSPGFETAQSATQRDRWTILPGMSGNAAFVYQPFTKCPSFRIEAGYRLDHYYNVSNSTVNAHRNFDFSGPFVSISWRF